MKKRHMGGRKTPQKTTHKKKRARMSGENDGNWALSGPASFWGLNATRVQPLPKYDLLFVLTAEK